MLASNLVLGTAQIGFPHGYGIANKVGRPDQPAATAIIHEAWKNGIREFDTAQSYGTGEAVLGNAMQELGISKDASIISKFDPVLDHLDRNVMTRALDGSLQRLGVEQLNGMMLHKGEFLSIWNEGLSAILFDLVSTGKVKHLGISVALPEEAIVALNTEGIDMIQMPANIFDRRFEKAGVYELAKDKKKDVYLRSIFLQGLLLLEVSAIPGRISLAAPFVEKLDRLAEEYCLTRHEIALGYVKSAMPAARVVFGVETKEQVAENLAGWQKDVPAGLIERIKMSFPDLNERILNPHLW